MTLMAGTAQTDWWTWLYWGGLFVTFSLMVVVVVAVPLWGQYKTVRREAEALAGAKFRGNDLAGLALMDLHWGRISGVWRPSDDLCCIAAKYSLKTAGPRWADIVAAGVPVVYAIEHVREGMSHCLAITSYDRRTGRKLRDRWPKPIPCTSGGNAQKTLARLAELAAKAAEIWDKGQQ